ncbi:MAG: SAM-dependent chlorinase/fluorinase [Candidatus Omnitrophica bacterium]|nr:SAM-dependent chlorinase/fluorinase [Candidatus Omnitrophota bacterium]
MRIISLLTDFGLKDNFVGVVKAVILSINKDVEIVDITHQILRHNIYEASFLLLNSFRFFPKGTIFLVVVDPGVGSSRYPIAIKTRNYYFVGPDNGVLSLAAEKDFIEKIVILEDEKYFLKNISSTFHARDIFAPVAAYISKKIPINKFGKKLDTIKKIEIPSIKMTKDFIYAKIIYQDNFGNLVTNLKKVELLEFLKNADFVAILNNKRIYKIYNCYSQAKDSEPFFIEGSFSFLEIAIKNKSAANFFRIKDKNFIDFFIRKRDYKREV